MDLNSPFAQLLTERHEDLQRQLNEILIQVKATNGRVRDLEHWKHVLIGGLTVCTLVIGWVVSLL